MVSYWWCFGGVSRFVGGLWVVSRWSTSVIRLCLGGVSMVFLWCVLMVFWSLGGVLVVSRWLVGGVSKVRFWSLSDFLLVFY